MSLFENNRPEPFWHELVVHDLNALPKLTGLNVGHELSTWRYDSFVDYIFDWLPEFALKYSDLTKINSGTAVSFIRRAARTVYNTDKYRRRGEFGELFLHAVIRELFNSEPIISKLYYKSAVNDTVKGFDAVHVVDVGGELELWLGEVKFYKDIASAITDVAVELHNHVDRDYLREEFSLVTSKIDDNWEYAEQIKRLLSERTSLDEVFKRLCIPVLLTYESPVVNNYANITNEFEQKLLDEISSHHAKFKNKVSKLNLNLHLFLMPLEDKQKLLSRMHKKLEGLQR